MNKIIFLFTTLMLACVLSSRAEVKLPSIFSDHMVLQKNAVVPVWGWADPGEQVTASLAGQTRTATADAAGNWRLQFENLSTTEPQTLKISGKNTIEIQDVLIGEVWLASGQSNMQLSVNEATNAWRERAEAKFPQIRMFTVGRHPATTPQTNCEGKWVVCAPETVGNFSAAGYFFARDIHNQLKVPVGVIHSSWGGTPIETWTSMPRMEGKAEFKPVFDFWAEKMRVPFDPVKAEAQYARALENWTNTAEKLKAAGKPAPPLPQKQIEPRLDKNYPANLFNGMIAPIVGYGIRGAIWYQGENNAGATYAALYAEQLPLLIQDWRERWGQGDFYFGWVQLPNFQPGTNSINAKNWPLIRECMLKSLSVKNTGMAITIDVGEAFQIHPKNKQAVGHRLALWARAQVYGEKIPYSGPLPAGQKIQGGKIIISFTHADGGLMAKAGELVGFKIAGADRVWHSANARIEGDQVIVWSDDVKSPVTVRYAWAANPVCNLFNGAGLPATSFRTDDWN
jgi:sialate O-acetylesterase